MKNQLKKKMKLKKQSDETLLNLADDFLRLGLKDRDDVIFDFEADLKKILRRVEVRKLLKKNKKYIREVKSFMKDFILQTYLIDMMKIGEKKYKRFERFYLES